MHKNTVFLHMWTNLCCMGSTLDLTPSWALSLHLFTSKMWPLTLVCLWKTKATNKYEVCGLCHAVHIGELQYLVSTGHMWANHLGSIQAVWTALFFRALRKVLLSVLHFSLRSGCPREGQIYSVRVKTTSVPSQQLQSLKPLPDGCSPPPPIPPG